MRELDNIGAAADEQQVGRNGGFGIPMHLADYSLYINVKIPSVNITTHLVMQYLLEEVHPSEPCLIFHHDSIASYTAQSTLNGTP